MSNTIDYIQVTVTPHELFAGARTIRVEVKTIRQRYTHVVTWPNDDFASHLDFILDSAKTEILAAAKAEHEQ